MDSKSHVAYPGIVMKLEVYITTDSVYFLECSTEHTAMRPKFSQFIVSSGVRRAFIAGQESSVASHFQ